MKIRGIVNDAMRELDTQVHAATRGHDCRVFLVGGSGCLVCNLLNIHKTLAALHFLRARGFYLDRLFPAEEVMLDLLGEEKLKRKFEAEIAEVGSFPRRKCFNCGEIITVWMTYTKAINYATISGGKVRTSCAKCGNNNYFGKDELSTKFAKPKNTKPKTIETAGTRPIPVLRNNTVIEEPPRTFQEINTDVLRRAEARRMIEEIRWLDNDEELPF